MANHDDPVDLVDAGCGCVVVLLFLLFIIIALSIGLITIVASIGFVWKMYQYFFIQL
jgi:hypothetical protein